MNYNCSKEHFCKNTSGAGNFAILFLLLLFIALLLLIKAREHLRKKYQLFQGNFSKNKGEKKPTIYFWYQTGTLYEEIPHEYSHRAAHHIHETKFGLSLF